MIKVACEMEPHYDTDKGNILIRSHFYNDNLIEIIIGDEKRIVKANDLKAAIDNCTNTAKY
jgi:hypothetical protein